MEDNIQSYLPSDDDNGSEDGESLMHTSAPPLSIELACGEPVWRELWESYPFFYQRYCTYNTDSLEQTNSEHNAPATLNNHPLPDNTPIPSECETLEEGKLSLESLAGKLHWECGFKGRSIAWILAAEHQIDVHHHFFLKSPQEHYFFSQIENCYTSSSAPTVRRTPTPFASPPLFSSPLLSSLSSLLLSSPLLSSPLLSSLSFSSSLPSSPLLSSPLINAVQISSCLIKYFEPPSTEMEIPFSERQQRILDTFGVSTAQTQRLRILTAFIKQYPYYFLSYHLHPKKMMIEQSLQIGDRDLLIAALLGEGTHREITSPTHDSPSFLPPLLSSPPPSHHLRRLSTNNSNNSFPNPEVHHDNLFMQMAVRITQANNPKPAPPPSFLQRASVAASQYWLYPFLLLIMLLVIYIWVSVAKRKREKRSERETIRVKKTGEEGREERDEIGETEKSNHINYSTYDVEQGLFFYPGEMEQNYFASPLLPLSSPLLSSPHLSSPLLSPPLPSSLQVSHFSSSQLEDETTAGTVADLLDSIHRDIREAEKSIVSHKSSPAVSIDSPGSLNSIAAPLAPSFVEGVHFTEASLPILPLELPENASRLPRLYPLAETSEERVEERRGRERSRGEEKRGEKGKGKGEKWRGEEKREGKKERQSKKDIKNKSASSLSPYSVHVSEVSPNSNLSLAQRMKEISQVSISRAPSDTPFYNLGYPVLTGSLPSPPLKPTRQSNVPPMGRSSILEALLVDNTNPHKDNPIRVVPAAPGSISTSLMTSGSASSLQNWSRLV